MNNIFRLLLLVLPILGNSQKSYLVHLKKKEISKTHLSISSLAIQRKLKFGISQDDRDYAVEASRMQQIGNIAPIHKSSRWFNAVLVECNDDQVEKIKKLEFVDRIELLSTNDKKTKQSSQKLETNYTKEQYGATYNQIHLHKGQTLHDQGYEGQGMKIAVFDAGFDGVDRISSFRHLFSENRIFAIKNIVENTNQLYTLDNHGTAVLGCMASYINDTIVASAPKASYYLFITEDPRSESRIEELNWAIGAEMADSIGVDIINSSLGYHHFDDASQNYQRQDMNGRTTIVSKAAAIALEKGIVVVNSAGNHGNKDWGVITAPADVEGVISVGALDGNANLADFSSRGFSKFSIIKPNIVGVGKGTTLFYDSGSYHFGSGTSFSSPLLAGLIACFWQKNQNLKPHELRTVLYSMSTNFQNPNLEIGFGMPQFDREFNPYLIQPKERILHVFPNPSTSHTILEITATEPYQNVEIEVYASSIAILKQKNNLYQGVNHIFLNTKGYALGLYFVKVKLGNYILEDRFLKVE